MAGPEIPPVQNTSVPPISQVVSNAVIATRTPIEVDAVLRVPAVVDAVIARATSSQIVAAVPRVPWWRSRGMVLAYIGIGTSLIDVLITLAENKDLSWRTVVIGIGSALAAYFKKNSSSFVESFTGIGDTKS